MSMLFKAKVWASFFFNTHAWVKIQVYEEQLDSSFKGFTSPYMCPFLYLRIVLSSSIRCIIDVLYSLRNKIQREINMPNCSER